MNSGSQEASFEIKPKEVREDNADEGLKIRVGWAAEPNEGGSRNDWRCRYESPISGTNLGGANRNGRVTWCDGVSAKGGTQRGLGQGCRGTRISDRRGRKGGSGRDGRGRSGDTNFGSNGRNSGHFSPKAVDD